MNRRLIGNAWLLTGTAFLGACSDGSSSGSVPSNSTATGGQVGIVGGSGGGVSTNSGGAGVTSGIGGAGVVTTGGTGVVTTGGVSGTTGGVSGTTGGVSGTTGGVSGTTGGVSGTTGGVSGTTGGVSGTTGGVSGTTGGTTSATTGGTTWTNTGGTSPTTTGGTSGDTGGTSGDTGGTSGDTGGTSDNTGGSAGATDPGTPGCDRAGLEAAVNSYLAALEAGDPSLMPLSASAQYVVNDASATLAAGEGLFQWAAAPDFHRNLFDVEACRSFTEVICATWSHEYVLGVALSITGSEISKIYVVETDEGDWAFGADNYLSRSKQEDWSLIPEGERLNREELDSGARAYFAFWGDSSVEVPWGDPCARLEGGSFGAFDSPLAAAWTDNGQWGSCSGGIPHDGFAPQPRESLIDPDYGMVVLLLNLGGTDSHLFRFVKDESLLPRTGYGYGMVYVHTLTQQ